MPKNNCGQQVNLFINGYEKAKGIENIASVIVKRLKFNNTINANKHKTEEQISANLIEILPDAIGLDFVLSTLLSNSLSDISFTIHPADLIKTDPKKNKIK